MFKAPQTKLPASAICRTKEELANHECHGNREAFEVCSPSGESWFIYASNQDSARATITSLAGWRVGKCGKLKKPSVQEAVATIGQLSIAEQVAQLAELQKALQAKIAAAQS